MAAKVHRYGWKPSLPDLRDYAADTSELPVLSEVDPRAELPAVYDQGDLGSCTANAVAAAIEYDAILDGKDFGTPSRLFIYYGERELEGSIDSDAGAWGRDGFKVARHKGVPPEESWPYDISRFTERPPDSAYNEALLHRIGRFVHVRRDVDTWKRVLSNKQTIAFGFTVYESFESRETASSGVVPYPDPDERTLGGHEVLAVGYLFPYPDYVLCRNSWSDSWGMNGYFLLPWRFITDGLASDFRTIPRSL